MMPSQLGLLSEAVYLHLSRVSALHCCLKLSPHVATLAVRSPQHVLASSPATSLPRPVSSECPTHALANLSGWMCDSSKLPLPAPLR